MMKKTAFLLAIMVIVLLSCEKTERLTVDELRAGPEQLTIGNNTLILEAYVWRDFMPVSPPPGSGLMSASRLMDIGQKPLPEGLSLRKQYVINGDEVWTSDFDDTWSSFDYAIEGVSRKGPTWEVGTTIYVICEFTYRGSTYRIQADSQQIKRTY